MDNNLILLVEDNPDDVELTLRAFEKNNIQNEMVVVRDGSQAVDYLFAEGTYADRDTSVMPQIVLLDLKMPKIDGLEVLRRLRADQRTKLIPVVILTTSNEEKDLISAYNLGASSYIRKPVNFARFSEVVAKLGEYWLVLNEPPPKNKEILVDGNPP